MSDSLRWKEYRVRQEIYKQRLKETESSGDGVDFVEPNVEMQNRIALGFFEQIIGERSVEQIRLVSNS
jgi:hypothetical protein